MPVPLLLFLGSLRKSPWSARTLMGWFLSVLSAQAGAAASRPQAQAASRTSRLVIRDIETFHVGAQDHAVVLHVAVHADAVHAAHALHHRDRVVGGGDVGLQVH